MKNTAKLAVFTGLTWLATGGAQAQQLAPGVQLSGFGSMGVNHASNDSGFFPGTDQGLDFKSDSLVGLKFDVAVNDKAEASIQLLSKGTNDWSADVEWAYLGYTIAPELKLRAGKLRLPLFVYSDYLDSRFSLPWVRPPQEVYSVIPTSGYTGAELNYEKSFADLQFTAQLYVGEATPENLVAGASSELSELRGTTLSLAGEYLTLRASYARANINLAIGAESAIPAGMYEGSASFAGIGLLYDDGTWLGVAETVKAKVDTQDLSDIVSAYLTIGYRLQDWMPYATVARAENSSDFPLQLTQKFLQSERQSTAVGLRWDFARGISVKTEVSRLYNFAGTSGLLSHNSVPSYDPQGQLQGFTVPYDSLVISSLSLDVIF